MKMDNKINIAEEENKNSEPLVAIYNNSNEIFGISGQRLLQPRGNAKVPASEAAMLMKNHKHAIHLQMVDEKKTISDFAHRESSLKAEIEALKAENNKLKAEGENKGKTKASLKEIEGENKIS